MDKSDYNCFPQVRYPYPLKGVNPFDTTVTDPFFIDASGFTNTTDTLDDFELDKIRARIPAGYKTVLILTRQALYANGKQAYCWHRNSESKLPACYRGLSSDYAWGYCLFSSKPVKLESFSSMVETYSVCKPGSEDCSLSSHVWELEEPAVEYAKKLSVVRDASILLAQLLIDINWH